MASNKGHKPAFRSLLKVANFASANSKEAESTDNCSETYRHKYPLVVLIQTSSAEVASNNPTTGDQGFVQPFVLGRLSQVNGPFVQLEAVFDRTMAHCPPQDRVTSPGSPEGYNQVLAAKLIIEVKEKRGWTQHETNFAEVLVDHQSTWTMELPAFSKSHRHDRSKSEEGPYAVKFKAAIPLKSSSSPDSLEMIAYENIRAMADGDERERLDVLLAKGNLHYLRLRFRAGHLSTSNTFLVRGEDIPEEFANFEQLYSSKVANTELTMHCLFSTPANGSSEDISCQLNKSLDDFREAQCDENATGPDFAHVWAVRSFTYGHSDEKSYKSYEYLPRTTIHVPVVFSSIRENFVYQSLDLHIMGQVARQANQILSKATIEARFTLIGYGASRTLGVFFRIPEDFLAGASFETGDSGIISFPGRTDIDGWSYSITYVPALAITITRDLYAVCYPPTCFDEVTGKHSLEIPLPVRIFDALEGDQADIARFLNSDDTFNLVQLKPHFSDRIEKQQYKALQIANPISRGDFSTSRIKQRVAPILAGHNMQSIRDRSIYSSGYIESMMACGPDGHSSFIEFQRRLSETTSNTATSSLLTPEQEELLITYMSQFPSDGVGLLECSTAAGNSFTCAVLAAFLHGDGGKQFLVLAEKHDAANTSARVFKRIVERITGKRVYRDFGPGFDLTVMKYILSGCPKKEYGAYWTKSLAQDEFSSLKFQRILDLVSVAIQNKYGTYRERFHSATELSLGWIILGEAGHFRLNDDGSNRFSRQKRTADTISTSPALRASSKLLVELLRKTLDGSDRSKKTEDACMELITCIRLLLFRDVNCAGVVTTVSNTDEIAETFFPQLVIIEDSHLLSIHNSTIVLAHFAFVPKLFVFDKKRPGPYCKDQKENDFAGMREYSFSVRENMRGRRKAIL